MPEARHRRGIVAPLVLGAVLAAVPAEAFDGVPSPERQAALVYRLRQDCGSCHGMTLKGGLGPALLPIALEGKDVAVLATIIRDGVPGTPMPPWAFELSEAEAEWLAARLKQGVEP